jgi:N-acetylglutamate synthase-like GNAT family acetyltransferase
MVIVITLAARHAGATPLHGDVDHLWLRDGTATWPLDVALYEARERRIMPLWQIRVTVEDTPGRLAAVAGGLGQLNINLLTVQVHPTADGAVDELIADVPADVSVAEISAAIRDGGGTDVQIRPAQILTTADGPTQAITLATRLVHDLGDLPWTLIDLLGDCTVSWLPDDLDVDTLEGTTMQLRDPESGRLVISRPAMPFTPTELARARALINLAGRLALVLAGAGGTVAVLLDGAQVTLRRARHSDLEAVADMHARCSPTALYRRYLVGTPSVPKAHLERLLAAERGRALLAEADSRVVALANLMWDGSEAEVGLLVEDAWQRRGLGTVLLRQLVEAARNADVTTIYALTLADNMPMIRTMARLSLPIKHDYADGVLTLTARLRRARFDHPLPCNTTRDA